MRRSMVRGVAFALGAAMCLAGAAPAAAATRERIPVVASFYPIAYAAQRVGGNLVEVDNLTPAGAEPHDLDLTPDQRDAIDDAALVFVLGKGFQPAVESAAEQRDRGTVELLDRLPIDTKGKKVAEEHATGTLDPHVWLDPSLMGAIADTMASEMGRAEPEASREVRGQRREVPHRARCARRALPHRARRLRARHDRHRARSVRLPREGVRLGAGRRRGDLTRRRARCPATGRARRPGGGARDHHGVHRGAGLASHRGDAARARQVA